MESLTSYDPRTVEPVGEVAVTPPGEIAAVVDCSRKAFESWSALTHAERKTHLKAFKRTVLDRGLEIAQVVTSETGKPLSDAYSTDVMPALAVMDHYIRRAPRYLGTQKGRSWPFITTRAWTEYHPRGVAAVVTPWNFPFFIPMLSTISALAAGCSVVLKPSEVTPLSGALLGDLAADAGLPADLVQVVHGRGDVGAALVESQVDVVAFTGSTKVGKMVAEAAAKSLKPVILELGGNDAMIVLEDANIKEAARAAVWAGMLNSGQACVSVERIYAVDPIFDEFVEAVQAQFDSVAAGSGDRREIGPIIHPPQIDIIEAHVADSIAKGAKILAGGRRVEGVAGIYYEPTLIVDVDHSMQLMRDETFGPILPIMRVRDEDAALEMANDSRFGLHGSIWTRNTRRGSRIASSFESGTVAINDVTVNFITPTVSFGGIGESGYGTNLGPEGLRSYCYPKSVTAARLPKPTLALLGARFPRRVGLRYWRSLARLLFRW